MTNNGVIDGHLLPPADGRVVSRFKEVTRFKTVLMGRRTHTNLGPLPQSINLVLSRMTHGFENVLEIGCIQDALEFSKNQEVVVVGGAETFNQFIPYTRRIYLTYIDMEEKRGTEFIKIIDEDWEPIYEEKVDKLITLKTLVRRQKEFKL